MKKIFILLFFAGCLTSAAFAQDGGRHRHDNEQYNNYRNSPYGYGRNDDGYDNDHQWRNRRGDDHYREHRYDHDRRYRRDDDDRRYRRDHDDRRYHRRYRDDDDYREMRPNLYGYIVPPFASLQVIFGHRDRD